MERRIPTFDEYINESVRYGIDLIDMNSNEFKDLSKFGFKETSDGENAYAEKIISESDPYSFYEISKWEDEKFRLFKQVSWGPGENVDIYDSSGTNHDANKRTFTKYGMTFNEIINVLKKII